MMISFMVRVVLVAVPATPVALCSEETSSSVTITLSSAAESVTSNYTVEADCSTVTDADGKCPRTSTGLDTTHVFSNLNSDTSYSFTVTATANKRRSAEVILACRTLKGQMISSLFVRQLN